MSKILKNTTLSDITLLELGITVPASGQYEVEPSDYLILAQSDCVTELTPLINSGDIVVNDGSQDLSIVDALAYIEYPDFAKAIRFDNSSNGFVSDDAQDAIEEAKISGAVFNGIDAGTYLTKRNLFCYSGTSGQIITSSPSTITINTVSSDSDSSSYLVSNGEIEFRYSDLCDINLSVTFDTINTTRSNTQSFLEVNKGSGFTKVTGSDIFTYERTSNADRQTGTKRVTLNIDVGDIIRVRSQVIGGSNNTSVGSGCSVTIFPATPASCEPNLTIDGSDLNQDEILGQLDAGEL